MGAGILNTLGSTSADLLIHHGIPWLGKKAVEMSRYYTSQALRNPKLQKKAIDYALDKLNPMIQNVGSQALDQLSNKIRPNRKYKTDRKDLDGSGIIDNALKSGVAGSPWQVDYKKEFKLLTDPELWAPVNKMPVKDAKKLVQYYKDQYKDAKKNGYSKSYNTFIKEMGWGAGLDIQKHLSKLGELHMRTPTMKKYNYCGPGTKLEQRLASNDPKIREPINNLDAICQKHDIAYNEAKSLKDKHKADDVMLDEISKIPYMKRPWGTTVVQAMITGKRKLGLGVKKKKPKNVTRRRVKKAGKKD